MYDRTPRTLLTSLTCLNMPSDKIITQTIFCGSIHIQVHSLTWERPLDTSSGISPRYLSATNSQLTASSLYRYNAMNNYAFFSKCSSQWGEAFLSLWGHLDICPLLHQFHVTSITQLELSSLTSLKAWGNVEESFSDIMPSSWSLLRRGTVGDRMCGLSTVWVNPTSGQGSHCGGSS